MLTGTMCFAALSCAAVSLPPCPVSRGVIVGFEPVLTREGACAILDRHGLELLEHDWAGAPGLALARVRTPECGGAIIAAGILSRTSGEGIRFAEPDWIIAGRAGAVPSDPAFNRSWGLDNTGQFGGTPGWDMDAPEAWDITFGDPAIVVLVIDTGVQLDHPDLNIAGGFDATGEIGEGAPGSPVNQFDSHGTAVAGCISGLADNALGSVGIAPRCRVASARAFISTDAFGAWISQVSWTIAALEWGRAIGARVSNNSNSYGFESQAIAEAYAAAREAGMIHFVSAGNGGAGSSISYPASLPSVLAIAAATPQGGPAGFSSAGPEMFLCAPGVSIYTTDRTGAEGYFARDHGLVDGTSFACAFAAGAAALAIAHSPGLVPAEVEELLLATARDTAGLGFDHSTGWGFASAFAALRAICPLGAACTGDATGDRRTDFGDLTLVLERWNQTGPAGDLDGDGTVGGSDLTLVLGDWGCGAV